jgi:hypothetical protein
MANNPVSGNKLSALTHEAVRKLPKAMLKIVAATLMMPARRNEFCNTSEVSQIPHPFSPGHVIDITSTLEPSSTALFQKSFAGANSYPFKRVMLPVQTGNFGNQIITRLYGLCYLYKRVTVRSFLYLVGTGNCSRFCCIPIRKKRAKFAEFRCGQENWYSIT